MKEKYINIIKYYFNYREINEIITSYMLKENIPDNFVNNYKVTNYNNMLNYTLLTSPEIYMKYIILQQKKHVFQISKAFRIEKIHKNKMKEFLLLEWYYISKNINLILYDMLYLIKLLFNILFKKKYKLNIFIFFYFNIYMNKYLHKKYFFYNTKYYIKNNILYLLSKYNFIIKKKFYLIYMWPKQMSIVSKKIYKRYSFRFEGYCNNIELINSTIEENNKNEIKKVKLKLINIKAINNINNINKIIIHLKKKYKYFSFSIGAALGLERFLLYLLKIL